MPIMMIEHTIFNRSNIILSDQNECLLSYNIMEEVLVKILLDQDDRANKFCSIICVFARSYDRGSALLMTLQVGRILDLNTVSTEPKFAHNFKVYVFEMVPFGI